MSKNEDKSTVLLKHHLKALKMPTILAECEKVAARCARENVDHLGFPSPKTLETFDFQARPSVNKPLVLELMRCEYIDKTDRHHELAV